MIEGPPEREFEIRRADGRHWRLRHAIWRLPTCQEWRTFHLLNMLLLFPLVVEVSIWKYVRESDGVISAGSPSSFFFPMVVKRIYQRNMCLFFSRGREHMEDKLRGSRGTLRFRGLAVSFYKTSESLNIVQANASQSPNESSFFYLPKRTHILFFFGHANLLHSQARPHQTSPCFGRRMSSP